MIITRLIGGLGNQLYQYSLGRHLSLKNNCDLLIDAFGFNNMNQSRKLELSNFAIDLKHCERNQLPYRKRDLSKKSYLNPIKDFCFSKFKVIDEKKFEFDPSILEQKGHIYLDGYWQTEKYFKPISNKLRADLKFRTNLTGKNTEISALIKNSNSISVHIRRGDYVTNEKNKNFYEQQPLSYFEKAIDIIASLESEPYYFIFSDDPKWAKDNIKTPYRKLFVEGNTTCDDLHLMTLCKHNIIANSTYSWWGAYLGDHGGKRVICPKRWFTSIAEKDTKDLIPEKWIQL
jgi:hypothetical protein